jgi:transcriptional regulator with XRE-family HTH domain
MRYYLSREERQRLRAAWQKKGLNQKGLAGLIGVSPSQLSRIARGLAECSPELRKGLEQVLDLKPNSLSPACPSRTCNGFIFGSPLPLNQPDIIVGPEVDDILATLPPEMRAIAARLALEVLSRAVGEIAQRLRAYVNEVSD